MSDTIEPDVFDPAIGGGYGGNNSIGVAPDAEPGVRRGTLDESVYDTFRRDISDINKRLKQVVYPHFCTCVGEYSSVEAEQEQIHCDLWAPLAFVLVYAISMSQSNTNAVFSSVFVSLWFVLLVMAVHLRLTKVRDGNSLLSYISIGGYCLFPLVINNILGQVLLPLVFHISKSHLLYRIYTCLRLVILGASLYWSVTAICFVTKSSTFIEIFPLVLCFGGIGWLSIIS